MDVCAMTVQYKGYKSGIDSGTTRASTVENRSHIGRQQVVAIARRRGLNARHN